MKIKKICLIALTLLPLIVTVIALFFMPDTVPAHFGPDLVADRFGSKFEALILPAAIVVIGVFALISGNFAKKESNKKLTLNIFIATLILFGILQYYLLFIMANNVTDMKNLSLSFDRLVCLILGAFLIYVGNITPMLKKNSLAGLRTHWSMKNSFVWKKCQRFSGIITMLTGFLFVLLAFIFPNVFLMLGIVILMGVVGVIYSYIAAKRDTHEAEQ